MSDTKKRAYIRTLKTYIVDDEGEDRIVRAYTQAEALRYCTRSLKIRPASHDDIIELMAAGVPVETVGLPEAVPVEESAGLTD